MGGSLPPNSPEGYNDSAESDQGGEDYPAEGAGREEASRHGEFDEEVALIGASGTSGSRVIEDHFAESKRVPSLDLERIPHEESTANSSFSQTESASDSRQGSHHNNGNRSA